MMVYLGGDSMFRALEKIVPFYRINRLRSNKGFASSGVSHIQGQWLARSVEGTGFSEFSEGNVSATLIQPISCPKL
jgi:hypothetical protein